MQASCTLSSTAPPCRARQAAALHSKQALGLASRAHRVIRCQAATAAEAKVSLLAREWPEQAPLQLLVACMELWIHVRSGCIDAASGLLAAQPPPLPPTAAFDLAAFRALPQTANGTKPAAIELSELTAVGPLDGCASQPARSPSSRLLGLLL